jgi:hypothetical protein
MLEISVVNSPLLPMRQKLAPATEAQHRTGNIISVSSPDEKLTHCGFFFHAFEIISPCVFREEMVYY